MNKLNDWQMREMIEKLLRSREFSFIANMTVADFLRQLALITLDNFIQQIESEPVTVGEVLAGKTLKRKA